MVRLQLALGVCICEAILDSVGSNVSVRQACGDDSLLRVTYLVSHCGLYYIWPKPHYRQVSRLLYHLVEMVKITGYEKQGPTYSGRLARKPSMY